MASQIVVILFLAILYLHFSTLLKVLQKKYS